MTSEWQTAGRALVSPLRMSFCAGSEKLATVPVYTVCNELGFGTRRLGTRHRTGATGTLQ